MLDPLVQNTIDSTRRSLRLGLARELALRTAVAVGLFLLGWLLVDRMLEPGTSIRLAAYAIAAAALVVWLWRGPLSALASNLSDERIAALIEHRHPELADTLLTSLAFGEPQADPVRQRLVEEASRHARETIAGWEDPQVVNLGKQRPWLIGAGLVAASLLALAIAAPSSAGVYLRRLALSEELWPRRVVLQVEGFTLDEQGRLVKRVARDAPYELRVSAMLTDGHVAPEEVGAVLRWSDGARARRQLAAVGEPTTGADTQQAYRMSLDRVRKDATVWLRGDDGRLGPLYLKVSPRPSITDAQVEITPPDYLAARVERQGADAVDRIPEGSRVTLHARCSKPLRRVAAMLLENDRALPMMCELSDDGQGFSVSLPPLTESVVLEASLLDEDGIESSSPFRLPIRVVADTPPQIEFAVTGVSPAVTAEAVLTAGIAIQDDHAIGDARLRMVIDQFEHTFALQTNNDTPGKLVAAPKVDLLTMRSDPSFKLPPLEPGMTLQLVVEAADKYNLGAEGQPHTVSSQTLSFTLVTPDELIARLEDREINLRKTFEQITDEARAADLAAQQIDKFPADTPEEARQQRRRLALARLAKQLDKASAETIAVRDSFQAIHDELSNNRIQNDDLKSRIDQGIIRPLRNITTASLPSLRAQVGEAVDSLAARPTDPALSQETQRELSATVEQMRAALEAMKAVETYNEVLALLRGIIQEQRGLSERTKDARKASLRSLLLD